MQEDYLETEAGISAGVSWKHHARLCDADNEERRYLYRSQVLALTFEPHDPLGELQAERGTRL